MNRRSILAAYKKKSSHFQTGVTGFKSGNLFNPGYFLDSTLFGRSESRLILSNTVCRIAIQVQSFS